MTNMASKTKLTMGEMSALKDLIAAGRPRWLVTMGREMRLMCHRLRDKGLVEFVARKPNRRGGLMGSDAIPTAAGRALAEGKEP